MCQGHDFQITGEFTLYLINTVYSTTVAPWTVLFLVYEMWATLRNDLHAVLHVSGRCGTT